MPEGGDEKWELGEVGGSKGFKLTGFFGQGGGQGGRRPAGYLVLFQGSPSNKEEEPQNEAIRLCQWYSSWSIPLPDDTI